VIDNSTAQALAIIITALGGPVLLISVGRSIFKWWTGRSGRERQRNRDIIDDLRTTEDRADDEAMLKRKAMEYASVLRRQLTEAGIEPTSWPPGLIGRGDRGPRK
jgi:hypothetical protein